VDGEVLHIRNLTLDVSVVRVHFDIRMHELEVNRSVVAPWVLIEWFSHPEWPRHFSRGADVQPSIVTRGPYSASVEVTTDGASPASEVVSVSGAMTAWRVRVEVPEGVMSNTSVSLDVSESGPLLYPFDESDPYSGLSVLSVETSSESGCL
jgi:hypothetical protein